MWMHVCINCRSACTWLFQNLALNTICLFFSFPFLLVLWLSMNDYHVRYFLHMVMWKMSTLHVMSWSKVVVCPLSLFIILELSYPLKYVYKNRHIRIWCMLYCFIFFPSSVIHPQISTDVVSYNKHQSLLFSLWFLCVSFTGKLK